MMEFSFPTLFYVRLGFNLVDNSILDWDFEPIKLEYLRIKHKSLICVIH